MSFTLTSFQDLRCCCLFWCCRVATIASQSIAFCGECGRTTKATVRWIDVKSRRQFAILGLFLCAGFIAFSNITNSWLLSDDFAQIGKILGGDFSVVWGKEHGGFFRPLFILSYLIDTRIWGARPFGFHLTNVGFHSLNAFLTYVLSLRVVGDLKLTGTTKRMVAIGAGVLFLLHPSHTEAVSWISGRLMYWLPFSVSLLFCRTSNTFGVNANPNCRCPSSVSLWLCWRKNPPSACHFSSLR